MTIDYQTECYYVGGCSFRAKNGKCKKNGCFLNDIEPDNPKPRRKYRGVKKYE